MSDRSACDLPKQNLSQHSSQEKIDTQVHITSACRYLEAVALFQNSTNSETMHFLSVAGRRNQLPFSASSQITAPIAFFQHFARDQNSALAVKEPSRVLLPRRWPSQCAKFCRAIQRAKRTLALSIWKRCRCQAGSGSGVPTTGSVH